jgi:hypothetical protein
MKNRPAPHQDAGRPAIFRSRIEADDVRDCALAAQATEQQPTPVSRIPTSEHNSITRDCDRAYAGLAGAPEARMPIAGDSHDRKVAVVAGPHGITVARNIERVTVID